MQLREETQPQLRTLIEKDASDKKKKAGTDEQKIGDLYTSFMDEKHLETLGTKPLAGELNKIRTLKDKKDIPALAAHLAQIGVSTPYGIYVGQDQRASTKYAAYIGQSGLGMPDRDYYLKLDDKRMADTRTKYQAHVGKNPVAGWRERCRYQGRCHRGVRDRAGRSAMDQGGKPRSRKTLQQGRGQ